MQAQALDIAVAVVEKANKQHHADAVLRTELKRDPKLAPGIARAAATAVFAYYRWLGWLDPKLSLRSGIVAAMELAERFAKDPARFDDDELIEKAVPRWAIDHLPVSPKWARALQREPVLWLRARRGNGSELAAKLGECAPFGEGRLADALEYRGSADLFRTPEFHAGEFELQDIASQAVGWICDAKPLETWWDACAGEGGKTLHLADLMMNKGLIWASDRAEWRLQKLKRRAARSEVFNYRAAVWSGGEKLPTKTKFDGILVDAPCSGTGTWHRNPQARWTTMPEDVQELRSIQARLLAQVTPSLKPGGKLVYSVCTMTRDETENVVAAFAERFPDFEPLPVVNPLQPGATPASQHWFWPQTHRGNGMFVSVWRRK